LEVHLGGGLETFVVALRRRLRCGVYVFDGGAFHLVVDEEIISKLRGNVDRVLASLRF